MIRLSDHLQRNVQRRFSLRDERIGQLASQIAAGDIRVAVFDLDGTLYSSVAGMERQIIPAIQSLASEMLSLPVSETISLLSLYKEKYGHAVVGLREHHNIDPYAFTESVYRSLDTSDVVPYEGLRDALSCLADKLRLFVITNSGRYHGRVVLECLGISDLFEGVVAFEDTGFALKPSKQAYMILRERVGVSYREMIYFDDSVRNIQTASQIGMHSVLVSNQIVSPPLFWEMHLGIEHVEPSYAATSTHNVVEFIGDLARRVSNPAPSTDQDMTLCEDDHKQLKSKVAAIQREELCAGVIFRLTTRHNVEPSVAQKMVKGLAEYLVILSGYEGVLHPPYPIDIAWHEALIDTHRYADLCNRMFGRFLHHTPPTEWRASADSSSDNGIGLTLNVAESHLGALDKEVWTDEQAPWMRRPYFVQRTVHIR